jgi:hypothetical protein
MVCASPNSGPSGEIFNVLSYNFQNNLVANCSPLVAQDGGSFVSGGLNHNVYAGCTGANCFKLPGGFTDFTGWKNSTGQDGNSVYSSNSPNLDANFRPQAGSLVIGAGANLTSLGIATLNSDMEGNPRPSTGAWDVGASNYTINTIQKSMGIRQAFPKSQIISTNPIQVALLKQYMQIHKSLKIYDLAGNPVKKELLKNDGVYLVRESSNQLMQKVAIIK